MESTNPGPRPSYTLIDGDVLPWTLLDDVFSNRANFADNSPTSIGRRGAAERHGHVDRAAQGREHAAE
ncbi:hypothetical protein DXG03_005348 [Asterophora parasitica]|uniref:Uncharacterized protein n=1 Tax=Asterophora parasitica TaxID=117018 RepID=A0A9P7G5W7_9AGAR|nr:hypothetical protein DXG03_005348 [Asterophora parasitica]